MKTNYLLAMALLFSFISGTFAQNADQRFAIPAHLTINHLDAEGAREIFKFGDGSIGMETGLKYYLNPSFNLAANLHFFVLDGLGLDENAKDYDLSLEYKFNNGYILDENVKLKPFITAGAGLRYNEERTDETQFHIPIGAGLRYALTDILDVELQSRYKIGSDDNNPDYLTTSIGLLFTLGSGKDSDGDGIPDRIDECPNEAGTEATNGCPDQDADGIPDGKDGCPELSGPTTLNGCPDSDGDGIIDPEDPCPNEAGTTENKGCPDSDGDGVVDKDDSCPQVAGLANLKGCPDADGDGVADKDDKCPQESGLVANQGCPEPDTDGDGVIDKEDDCPKTPGLTTNKGCPEIEEEVKEILIEALEGVQFRSGSGTLLNSSYGKLDKVVEVMKSHPEFKLKISGYTDNTGNEQKNLELSQTRAHAAEKYIVDKGIAQDRVEAEGYGIANPVADNATREGRAKNRRVEFEIVFD